MNHKLDFCILSLVSLALLSGSAFAASGKVVGQIGLVDGEVFVDAKAVQKNAPVHEGSVVEVKEGHATLLLGKGSVFNLAPNSKMVVTAYQPKTDTTAEGADLDLKFGRTRALIQTEGKEKKNIQIRARAATMGVRGTEIYIDAPKDAGKPLQFFTLEGKADVIAHPGAPVVALAQNQGVTATGVAPVKSPNSATRKNPVGSAQKAGSAESGTTISKTTILELKADLKKEGLERSSSQVPALNSASAVSAPGSLSGIVGIGSLSPFHFDPLQDKKFLSVFVRPKFCNAVNGVCN
jgi:hypothetical protein